MFQTFDRMTFHAPTPVGKTRSLTKEGFLLCEGVPIARIGTQRYTRDDLRDDSGQCPLQTDVDGVITVARTADEVFDEVSMASFCGKPVTIFHPDEFVTPANWKQHTVGTVNNVRRGKGDESDLLVADLLVTDAAAIAFVNLQLPEVSCGYDCDYVQTALGKATQRNIKGNHVALLVGRGRAGPRVSIRDNQPLETPTMKLMDRLSALFKGIENKDQAAIDAALKDEAVVAQATTLDAAGVAAIVAQALEARDAAAKKLADEAAAAEAAAAAATTVEVKLVTGDALSTVRSRAEILSPGISIPTGDALADEAVAGIMQAALTGALTTDAGKDCVAPFLLNGVEVSALKGDQLQGVFNGAAELMRARNNKTAAATQVRKSVRDFGKAPPSPEEQNAVNAAFWAKHGG